MWRFMLVTFAFLAVAFYELSGGSDYVPGQNSIQVQGLQLAEPSDVRVAGLEDSARDSAAMAEVTRAMANLSDLKVNEDSRFQITLASVNASNEYDSNSELPKVERVPEVVATTAIDEAVEDAIAADVTAEREQPDSVATGFVGEEVFSLETYVMRQSETYTIPESVAEDSVITVPTGDIRQVTGDLVNMRAGPGTDFEKVGQLGKGSSVAVLEEPGNGWVMLEVVETGEIGWMADWLITTTN
ncbi:SH3 domain-containing protein [Roseovarius faecimaris]|nr:SH3 domain-containing protein [Roseovarius faecimaris]